MGKKKICIGLIFLGIFLFTACGNDSKSSTISEINNSSFATGALSNSGTDGSSYGDTMPGSEENETIKGQNQDDMTGSMDSVPNDSPEAGSAEQSVPQDEITFFKSGTWECLDGEDFLGYFYVESGKNEMDFTDLSGGSVTNYICEVENNQVTLINGDSIFASGTAEQLDEDTVIITSERGKELTFVYVSEKTGEERE